jgi:NAD(P)-dependent dehydrogenase (short-subunit alcohol dehydrogenase family)
MRSEPNSRSVLITGATDGLGKAAALLLAERGYRVFAAGRSPEKRAQLDALAREKQLPLESMEMDVCDDASVQAAVGNVLAKAGAIDVLINNAGVGYIGTIEDLQLADWRRQYETNVFGVLRVTQAALPSMRQRRRGRILMMSSVAGLVTVPAQRAYSSSKHALEGLTNALRLEMFSFGIEVILIEPGYIATGMQQSAADLTKDYTEKFKTGPYSKLYKLFQAGAKSARAKSKTTPGDCARVILRAIEAPRPKPRYGVTPLATVVKWGKRLLSDRAVDSLILRRLGIERAPR